MWARVVVCKHARWRNPWWNPTRSQCKLGKWLNVASRRHHWWCRCYWSRLSSCVPSLFAWPHCSPGHISQDKVQEQTLSYVCIYVYIIVYIYFFIWGEQDVWPIIHHPPAAKSPSTTRRRSFLDVNFQLRLLFRHFFLEPWQGQG